MSPQCEPQGLLEGLLLPVQPRAPYKKWPDEREKQKSPCVMGAQNKSYKTCEKSQCLKE